MKIGVFSLAMPEYSPEEAVPMLKDMGYDGIEWRVADGIPQHKPDNYTTENRYWSYNRCTLDLKEIDRIAPSIGKLCSGAGLEVCSLTTYLRPGDTEDIRRVLKAAVVMGCKNVRSFPPSYDESENYRVLFDRTLKQVEKLEQMAGEYGVRIIFEQHMNTIIPSASAAFRLVSGFDPKRIGIIFDPGNMVYEGFENYKMAFEILGDHLAHVHVKNAVWRQIETKDDGTCVWKPEWANLKKGYADLKKVGSLLRANGYDGYISLEDFTNEEDTLTKLRNSLEFMKEMQNS